MMMILLLILSMAVAAPGFGPIGVGWLHGRYLPAHDRSSFAAINPDQGE